MWLMDMLLVKIVRDWRFFFKRIIRFMVIIRLRLNGIIWLYKISMYVMIFD